MQKDWKLIVALWQGFGLMIVIGIAFTFFLEWGNTIPFIFSLFQSEMYSFSTLVLIGIASGIGMALSALGLIKVAKLTMPENDLTEMLYHLVSVRGGLLTMSVGAGVAEEFLFRGVLIGLFLTVVPVWVLLPLNALLFMLVHIPQYRGRPMLHGFIFIIGLFLAYLFYATGSLIAPIIAHFIYNYIVGVSMRKAK